MSWSPVRLGSMQRRRASGVFFDMTGDVLCGGSVLALEYHSQMDGWRHDMRSIDEPEYETAAINRAMRNLGMIPEAE